jgi:hypothetical protein
MVLDCNLVHQYYISADSGREKSKINYNPKYIINEDSISVFYEIVGRKKGTLIDNQFFAYKTDIISHINFTLSAIGDTELYSHIMKLKCSQCESDWSIDMSKIRILHDTVKCTCEPPPKY